MHEDVISAFRVGRITTRALFVGLDPNEDGLRETAKQAFGIDISKGFEHKREMAKLLQAWSQGKVMNDTKVKVDALAKAHGEQTAMLPEDYDRAPESLQSKARKVHSGQEAPQPVVLRGFHGEASGRPPKARVLVASRVSAAEEEKLEASKPEISRQFGLHLDSSLTVQTKRRYVSKMPTNVEELRAKYAVMRNMWLLAQMRQPGTHLFCDLDKDTWLDFLEELLSEDNSLFEREIEGRASLKGPDWNACVEYEFQLRKEACRLIRDEGYGIQSALWTAYEDPQHRMRNWIQLLTEANAKTDARDQEIQALNKRMLDMERAQQRASKTARTYNGSSPSGIAPSGAIDEPSLGGKGKGKSKNTKGGKNGKGKGNSKSKDSTATGAAQTARHCFENVIRKHGQAHFIEKARQNKVCFKFQKRGCTEPWSCGREHICVGCGALNIPYDTCLCHNNKL